MTDELSITLQNRATYWAGQITKLANSFAPNHLKNKIHSKTAKQGDGTFIITTTATGLDAAAQEHGSGLKKRDRRRRMARYPIRPKTKGALAFYENAGGTWDYSRGMPQIYAPDGRGVFFQVMHPGIKAYNNGEGYIRPAFKEIRKQIRKDLKQDVPNAIRATLNTAFKTGKEK